MKYIRTKDGRILKIFAENVSIWEKDDGISYYGEDTKDFETSLFLAKTEIFKQADTIWELCDEFDWKWDGKEFPYSTARQHVRYSGYGDLKRAMREEENYGKYLNYDYEIYGGIWIDEGFIYKAKMKCVLPNGEIDWKLL